MNEVSNFYQCYFFFSDRIIILNIFFFNALRFTRKIAYAVTLTFQQTFPEMNLFKFSFNYLYCNNSLVRQLPIPKWTPQATIS